MSIYVPGKVVLRQEYIGTDDPDAAAYIAAVEAADEAASPGIGALETGVKVAIHSFVKGCKADGIWPALKASCILAGARTLDGCLVPLVGAAPTSFNFVEGDYNRETGLVGNGSSKYLNSNRANNADPQNSSHNACCVSSVAIGTLMASSNGNSGQNYMDINTSSNARFLNRNNVNVLNVSGLAVAGLYGHVRSASTGFTGRAPQGSSTQSFSSQSPESRPVLLFARSDDGVSFSNFSSTRLSFYSIGEALNLALLDTRVTALINAIGAAIP